MSEVLRKKSPRAPSILLEEAIERAARVYDKEKRHPAPTDVVAQDMGYKSANNGAALSVLASMRYYGLLEKPEDGKLAVAKDVESFQYAPDEAIKRSILKKWLRAPAIFSELLDKYVEGLPSDATLRYELINRGFSPVSAESVIGVFRKSVEFADYFSSQAQTAESPTLVAESIEPPAADVLQVVQPLAGQSGKASALPELLPDDADKIPVRLSGGRRAWLVIPHPFYEADKKRLKAQIDLLLSEDEKDKNPA